ncbi:hypothetical protein ACJX0J_023527, partial [Zea mays]
NNLFQEVFFTRTRFTCMTLMMCFKNFCLLFNLHSFPRINASASICLCLLAIDLYIKSSVQLGDQIYPKMPLFFISVYLDLNMKKYESSWRCSKWMNVTLMWGLSGLMLL